MDLYKLAWLIWTGGTILIILSWNGTVSREVGWAGFVIALIGVGLSFIPHVQAKFRKPLPSPPICQNCQLAMTRDTTAPDKWVCPRCNSEMSSSVVHD
jgi:hypothetical protein